MLSNMLRKFRGTRDLRAGLEEGGGADRRGFVRAFERREGVRFAIDDEG